ncbi:MAG: hypothetical protein FWG14_11010 [Peptococcaceae bacterium]|nr:hypothetical protein [Peptococcaceae bacterium]
MPQDIITQDIITQDITNRRKMKTPEIISLILAIVLFVLAALLLIYTVWAYTYYADAITQAEASGQISSSENGFEIMSVYMGNCVQYLVFALLLFGVGWLLFSQAIKGVESTPKFADSIPAGEVEFDRFDREADTAAAPAPQDNASEDDASEDNDDDLEEGVEENSETESGNKQESDTEKESDQEKESDKEKTPDTEKESDTGNE